MFTDSLDTGIHYSRTGRPTGDRYRYISDEEVHYGDRYRYFDDNTYKIVNGRYRGERTQLSVSGTIFWKKSPGYKKASNGKEYP